MIRSKTWLAAATLALTLPLGAPGVLAQTATEPEPSGAPAPETALDPQNLALARQILTIAFPPAQREAKMHELLTTMTSQFTQSVDLDKVSDPGLRALFESYFASIPEALRPAVAAFIPKQIEAISHAYARQFTRAQLTDTLAFARSPSGAAYLQHALDVMSDPEVAAANTAYMKDVLALGKSMGQDLQLKINAYIKAHPEVAKEG
ncbi:hypothetical protein MTR62_03305 [Novosphingobium sp. 1949]|uniref:DUF2059 domain-containing protein n=1 Tax=Novosphingobium organovorum TaxID=2930092 RepID=A0ABT0B9J3_9SPHN|nr:hypothetical protein [Novosphingobium organovorum]MCJ2181735.1 hypothetical protein [Novosphingobium organovorum]